MRLGRRCSASHSSLSPSHQYICHLTSSCIYICHLMSFPPSPRTSLYRDGELPTDTVPLHVCSDRTHAQNSSITQTSVSLFPFAPRSSRPSPLSLSIWLFTTKKQEKKKKKTSLAPKSVYPHAPKLTLPTHTSHSQTSCLLSDSLSLGTPFPRSPSVCETFTSVRSVNLPGLVLSH